MYEFYYYLDTSEFEQSWNEAEHYKGIGRMEVKLHSLISPLSLTWVHLTLLASAV